MDMFSLLIATLLPLLVSGWPQLSFKTEPNFTSPQLQIDQPGTPNNGLIFLTMQNEAGSAITSNGNAIYENSGDLIYHEPDPTIVERHLSVQTLHGKPVLTYWGGLPVEHDGFGHGYGWAVILDQQYNVAHNVCLSGDLVNIVTPDPDTFPGTFANPCYLDSHEAYITDQGTLVGTIYNVTRRDLTSLGGMKNGWIFDCLIFEQDIKTNKLLFLWSALDHIDFHTSNFVNMTGPNPLQHGKKGQIRGSTQSDPWDWFHINSVQPVDGGYIINSRMTWSSYFINGKSGAVEWVLNGNNNGTFKLDPPDTFFSWQHMARLESGSASGANFQISLFNDDSIDGIVIPTNASNGLQFAVDTASKTAKVVRKQTTTKPLYALAQGGYQSLPNKHVMIAFGSAPVFGEYDENDKLVYMGRIASGNGNSSSSVRSYRAYRNKWTATPYYAPKALAEAETSNKTVTAYMSWNGATDVDSWNVYAGATKKGLSQVASNVKKTGFETMENFKDGKTSYRYVVVEAVSGGKGVRNSTAVKVTSAS